MWLSNSVGRLQGVIERNKKNVTYSQNNTKKKNVGSRLSFTKNVQREGERENCWRQEVMHAGR